VAQPLLPLRIVLDRTRGSAYLAVALVGVGMFGVFLFFTYQMQIVMGYSPVLTGVAFLPMTGAVLVSAGGIASRLIAFVPPRALIVPGLAIVAAGLFWASRLSAGSSYTDVILPAELLIGFGVGWVMAPSMNYATYRVAPGDAGVASATVNTGQQIGASVGTALLNTIAAAATTAYLASRPNISQAAALVHGYATAAGWAAAILAAAAILTAVLITAARPAPHD
jgi:hypothetical protein